MHEIAKEYLTLKKLNGVEVVSAKRCISHSTFKTYANETIFIVFCCIPNTPLNLLLPVYL